jgi:hypothetical protein
LLKKFANRLHRREQVLASADGVFDMKRNAKAPRRIGIFGRPPILEGESEVSYWELHEHLFGAFEPADFIDEILVRDGVNHAWNINRLRQVISAFVTAKVRAAADRKVSSLVEDDPELISGTEEQKHEMAKLLNPDSDSTWEAWQAQYPRAAAKYNKLWEAAWSTLDLTEIRANIMVCEIDTIEHFGTLIMIEERRFDSIIREIDRRRMMRDLRHDLHNPETAKIKAIETKMISGNKKVA